jgi:two-component system response regulator NreC
MLIGAQPDMEVIGEAADGAEAIRLAVETKPDVVTMDITMPGMSGIKAIEQLRQLCPSARVLALTMHDDSAFLRAVLAAGGAGYVVKTAADTELLSAIRAVHEGRTIVDLKLDDNPIVDLAGGKAANHWKNTPVRLSQRERETLILVAQGHTNQQVADRLSLSVKTVETYRARIADKLGLRTRADLVRYAMELGLLVPGTFLPTNPS